MTPFRDPEPCEPTMHSFWLDAAPDDVKKMQFEATRRLNAGQVLVFVCKRCKATLPVRDRELREADGERDCALRPGRGDRRSRRKHLADHASGPGRGRRPMKLMSWERSLVSGDWVGTGSGWGKFTIQHSRKTKRWYLLVEHFGETPTVIGSFDSRKDAQRAADDFVARLIASKAERQGR